MKASELINKLHELLEEHGDLVVKVELLATKTMLEGEYGLGELGDVRLIKDSFIRLQGVQNEQNQRAD